MQNTAAIVILSCIAFVTSVDGCMMGIRLRELEARVEVNDRELERVATQHEEHRKNVLGLTLLVQELGLRTFKLEAAEQRLTSQQADIRQGSLRLVQELEARVLERHASIQRLSDSVRRLEKSLSQPTAEYEDPPDGGARPALPDMRP